MISSRKSQLPLIKTILVLLITIFILVTYMFILNSDKVNIEDRKLNAQLIISELFNKNCFSNEFGVFDLDKFNQDTINSCLVYSDDILVALKFDESSLLYLGDKNEFNLKSQLCSNEGNVNCYKMIYPVVLKDKSFYKNSNLIVYIISF